MHDEPCVGEHVPRDAVRISSAIKKGSAPGGAEPFGGLCRCLRDFSPAVGRSGHSGVGKPSMPRRGRTMPVFSPSYGEAKDFMPKKFRQLKNLYENVRIRLGEESYENRMGEAAPNMGDLPKKDEPADRLTGNRCEPEANRIFPAGSHRILCLQCAVRGAEKRTGTL